LHGALHHENGQPFIQHKRAGHARRDLHRRHDRARGYGKNWSEQGIVQDALD